MYPELAMCYTIMCCKKENTKRPVISPEDMASYMPYYNQPQSKNSLLEL
jgi:hypothetical protein